jgi:putative ABC transport system permease protein
MVTLLIAAGGVLVVTYLNVVDRTWEIGLRMAIGARRRDIAEMFIVEACCLSGFGGMVGVLVGVVAVALLGALTAWPMAVDIKAVAVSLLAAVTLGIAAGAGPAIRASSLMPVHALGSK